MKLALDTYAINKVKDLQTFLDFALDSSITTIDTASIYPDSEETLGQYNLENFDVITKTIKSNDTLSRYENFELIKNSFYLSQRKLGYIPLYALMFHSADDIINFPELLDLANDFKDKEYVLKIGVCVYTPEQLIEIIDSYDIDIVQLPLNIFEQEFLGLLPELHQKGIEIHTRNTFYEGILLKNKWQIEEKYRSVLPVFDRIPNPKVAYALNFLKQIEYINKIIISAVSVTDLRYFIEMYNTNITDIDFSQFRI